MPRISEFTPKYAPSPSAFVAGVDVNENGEKINVQIPFSAFGDKTSFTYYIESNAATMSELINYIKSKGYIDGATMCLGFAGENTGGVRLGKYVGHILAFGGNMFSFCLFDYTNLTLYVRSGGYITETISDAFENARPERYTSGGIKYVTVDTDETTTFADIATAIETEGGSMLGVNFVKIVEGDIDGNYLLNCYVYNGNTVSAYMLDLETLTQYSTNGATGLTNTLKDLIINRTYGSVTEVGGGLPYESVMWNSPLTDMLDKITPYVTDSSKKTIIQLSGYGSALLLVSGSRWLKDGKEAWLLNATNLYNGKMFSTGEHIDPTTISINDFLNSGNYEVGGGLQYEHVKWNSRDDTLDTITAVISKGDISKKTIIYLKGCDYALLLVNGVWNASSGWTLDITNLYNVKRFRVEGIDPTTITIYDFLNSGEYEVKEENGSANDYIAFTVDGGGATSSMKDLKAAIEGVRGRTDIPTFAQLQGPNSRTVLIWFKMNGDETGYVYCWDLELKKYYYAEGLPLSQVRINDFFSIYEVKQESSGGSPMTSITYSELKALRDSGSLVAGMFYRITDYVCTTAQDNTRAMANQFDIIVQAISSSALSEEASADHHEGDTYFADSNLGAWELRYCLDNDTSRFAWADEENGKGVVYYMKDEHGNECPYDFKNITYKGDSIRSYESAGLSGNTYYPTFIEPVSCVYSQWGKTDSVSRNSSLDTTIDGVAYYGYTCSSSPISWSTPNFYITDTKITTSSTMYKITDGVVSQISMGGQLKSADSRNNVIKPYVSSGVYTLPCIIFVSTSNSNIVCNNCYKITFYGSCIRNTVGEECTELSFSSASNTTVSCGNQYYVYEGNGKEEANEKEYFPMLTYNDIGNITTLENIASRLEQGGSLGDNLIFRFIGNLGGDFIGFVKLNDDGTYDFEFRKLLGYDIYSGKAVSGSTTWGDIRLYKVQEYSTNPITALEARIAALEGTTT